MPMHSVQRKTTMLASRQGRMMLGEKKPAVHAGWMIAVTCVLCLSIPAHALDASDFTDLVGFTVVASSRVKGDYFGAEAGRPVVLDNGMSFSFSVRFSTYSYRPVAVVFARLPREALPAPGAQADVSASAYKLLVQDRIYDATRLR